MKIFRKTLAILLTLCLLTGAIPMMTLMATAQGDEYETYELYDYLVKVKDKCDSGTTIVNDTPWSLQVRGYAEGEDVLYSSAWSSPFQATARDGAYIYYYNSGMAWGYYPGFGFFYPTDYNGVDRLYVNIATPTNSSGYWGWRTNVAYAFTAPQDGMYQVQKADQNLVNSFGWANYFLPYDAGALDFGVRITVDDVAVWPTDEMSYYSNGWGVFGNGSLSTVSQIEVPTLSNMKLRAGQVVRVEFTNFTATDSPWLQRILGSFAVRQTGEYPQEVTVPEQNELPIRYEVYDYLTANAYSTGVASPWNVQVNKNESGWNNVDSAAMVDSYSYLHWSSYDWGGNWPGIQSYQPANYSEIGRYYLAYMTATNCWGNQTDVAYCFTAPYTGNYQIGKADQAKVVSFEETNYFKFRRASAPADSKCGVRITIDGKTIWPTADDSFYDSGYACFGPGQNLPHAIEVPQLNVFMTEDSVLRVEYREFMVCETAPWDIEVTGLVAATLTDIEGIAAPVSREIEALGLYDAIEDIAIDTSYEIAAGTSVANSNTGTLSNDGVHLSFSAPSQGIRLALNGFEFILDGENSALKNDETVYPITVAENEDGLYRVNYFVQPAFLENAVVGTQVSLTINGVSYEQLFMGAAPVTGKNGTLIVENLTENDSVTVMPGDLQLVSNSTFSIIGTVLYVGEENDLTAVKNAIIGRGKYSFVSEDVVTDLAFMRDGLDEIYTIAVKGDIGGDGMSNIIDIIQYKKGLAEESLSDAQVVAANFGDATLSAAASLVNMINYLLTY